MSGVPHLETIPTKDDIQVIHKQIKPYINHTSVLTSQYFNNLTGAELYFKCENFQKVGAFKMRGASSAILSLSEEERWKGVATHSSGNHAQAVARGALMMEIPAHIVMPSNAPKIKVAATQGYAANITFCEPTLIARETTLDKVVAETGATFIHPYNNYNVIAGQATAAKELLEEIPTLDVLIAPVGGGGLASGTALWAHYLEKQIKVYGSEPELVNDAYRSLQAGKIIENDRIDTIADGLRTNLGPYTFEILKNHLTSIITVSEEEIKKYLIDVWERMKLIIEPSSVVPLAAIIKQKELFKGKKVGILLSGGNVDLAAISNEIILK
jgi:threonine dehydratase